MHRHSLLHPGTALAVLMGTALPCVPASAAHALTVCAADGRCGRVQAIDDMQMAAVAGKYTVAGEVVGMNLTMASSWQSANGQNLEGKAMLSIALPQSGHAQARYGTQVSATDPQQTSASTGDAPGTVSTGSGLQGINGVSQVIQIAGDNNGAANHAQVNVTTAPIGTLTGNGQLNASYRAANGAQASAAITGNGVSLRLTMPGAGIAGQQINAGNLANIQQNIQFAADRQQVMNQLQLQLQIQPPSGALLASSGVGQALNMLRGK
jgi:hypothetical protein